MTFYFDLSNIDYDDSPRGRELRHIFDIEDPRVAKNEPKMRPVRFVADD
jgi:hypothetical protein